MIPAIFVVGILVFVHELGHFLFAKWRKVRVEKFSLGFGPEITGRTIGETRYVLSAIPLGGYVKMAGETPSEEIKGEPYEYLSKTVKERIGIVAAGPIMNVIFCIVIIAILFLTGLPYIQGRIGKVMENSPAEKAGLKSGDIITGIDKKEVNDWESLTKIIHSNPGRELEFAIKRGDERFDVSIAPQIGEKSKVGLIGITPYYGRKVGRISKKSPAYQAGLKPGDEIIAVSGKPVSQWDEIMDIIDKEERGEISLSILRRNESNPAAAMVHIRFTPARDRQSAGVVIFDFTPQFPEKRYPFFVSFGKAFSRTFYLIKITYAGLWKLVRGQVSFKLIGGPIMIAQLAGQEAQMGLNNLFMLIAIISVNLAVLNFMPIPVLDGGHIFFLLIEGIMGKPLSRKKQEIAQQIGIAVIIGLMLLATYNDILRFLEK